MDVIRAMIDACIAIEKGLKEYDVDLDTGSRRYDLRVTAIK